MHGKGNMKVLKFGGSSVGTPDRILVVIKIIEAQSLPCVVVVSAFQGVTDTLLNIADLASKGNPGYIDLLEKVVLKQKDFAEILIRNNSIKRKLIEAFEGIVNELRETCRGIFLL
ncbi:MAG: bifunctional aspartokinase / homoserine dehydrogenase 1, partial [Bacteroidota bacterium]|nr:bifunctional aspartokinase / homoserine dehydrogenase 1 [Bacteroidota bacterium]